MVDSKVLILMATYNGEQFLEEQLKSIMDQDYDDWNLIISDDCSTDNTVAICKQYMRNDGRIILYQQEKNFGALRNFDWLIKKAKEPPYEHIQYIMFSDQDDVWLYDKISLSIKMLGGKRKKSVPALVYTSKQYVDQHLNPIHIKIKSESSDIFPQILHQNFVYGCTIVLNKSLLDILEEIPDEFLNHDHYIVLRCFLYGKIFFIEKKTILYRQHKNNTSGNIYRSFFSKFVNYDIMKKNIILFYNIVNYVYNNQFYLSKKQKETISILQRNIRKRKLFLLYYLFLFKIKKDSFLSTIKFYVMVIFSLIKE